VIEFLDVAVSRGPRVVLKGISLAVAQGEIIALVGQSGSGKTTLLRLVNHMLRTDSGEVRVAGKDVGQWDETALRRQTGYAIQEVGLFPHFTVAENVALVPSLLEWSSSRIEARVDELLRLVGLLPTEFRDRWPDELSGGQRQRVGLARALAADPPILLMDEPFGALDPITRAELHREFRRLQQEIPRTVLLVTHDLAEAFALANRVGVLHNGQLLACDTPAALTASQEPYVRTLVETRFG
jgi:osmoprotectant transport system ATP-binding protein